MEHDTSNPKIWAQETMMCVLKGVPLIGRVADVLDSIHKRYEMIELVSKIDQIEANLPTFEKKMRQMVKAECERFLGEMRKPNIDGSVISAEMSSLQALKSYSWNPGLFEGMFKHSSHWPEMQKCPETYGRVLNSHDDIDLHSIPIFISRDNQSLILELTPFAFHSLLAKQRQGVAFAKIVETSDIWALPDGDADGPLLSSQQFGLLGKKTYSCGGQTHTMKEYRHEQTGIELVLIPGGSFEMGKDYRVTLTAYLMGKYPCRQREWQSLMGSNPSHTKGQDRPVEQISWQDCHNFCQKTGLRLPTEAQWEYACRGGNSGKYCFGNDDSQLEDYAWYDKNSKRETHSVGQKKPNGYGLYDMHGNVWEWCADWYGKYLQGNFADPIGPKSGSFRVSRGGCLADHAYHCRSSFRYDLPQGPARYLLGVRFCAYF